MQVLEFISAPVQREIHELFCFGGFDPIGASKGAQLATWRDSFHERPDALRYLQHRPTIILRAAFQLRTHFKKRRLHHLVVYSFSIKIPVLHDALRAVVRSSNGGRNRKFQREVL